MDDLSIMPFGQHKGTEMANVPDEYLLWFHGENIKEYTKPNHGTLNGKQIEIMDYIIDSLPIS